MDVYLLVSEGGREKRSEGEESRMDGSPVVDLSSTAASDQLLSVLMVKDRPLIFFFFVFAPPDRTEKLVITLTTVDSACPQQPLLSLHPSTTSDGSLLSCFCLILVTNKHTSRRTQTRPLWQW